MERYSQFLFIEGTFHFSEILLNNSQIGFVGMVSGGNRSVEVAFCAGFGLGATVFALGVLANLWNPIGWGGSLALAAVTVGCVLY